MTGDANGFVVTRTGRHLHVAFNAERTVLSSAVLAGGRVRARHIVNLRVAKSSGIPPMRCAPPAETLCTYCRQQGWKGPIVGMMTAASMDSFRRADRREQGATVTTLVTAGISNAGRAGDPAVDRLLRQAHPEAGTVNIIVVTDALLTESAMVEAVMTVTEAKAAAFQNLDVRSTVSGGTATGTGTDAVAVVSGFGPAAVAFCGKHVVFGEMLADTTIRAISDSLGN